VKHSLWTRQHNVCRLHHAYDAFVSEVAFDVVQ
jgi:hypothetical protein